MADQAPWHRAAIVERAEPPELKRWAFGGVADDEPAFPHLDIRPGALRAVLVVPRGEVNAIADIAEFLDKWILAMRAVP